MHDVRAADRVGGDDDAGKPARPRDVVERLSFLSEASAILAAELGYETTLANVARLVVPRLASWCAVYVVEADGSIRRLASAHVDQRKASLMGEVSDRYPLKDDPKHPVRRALTTGKTYVPPPIPREQVDRFAVDEEHARILRDLDARHVVIVPLIARGRPVGAMSYGFADGETGFDRGDLQLAEELAQRCAIAVDNARLYREARLLAAEREAILGQLAEGVILADPEGRITFVNRAAERILGRAPLGTPVPEYSAVFGLWTVDGRPFPPEELPLARAVLRGESVADVEIVVKGQPSDRLIQASAARVLADDGSCLGAAVTFRDITAQRELERQRDEFLASASHDLKNPLSAISTQAELLQRRVVHSSAPEAERVQTGLRRITAAAARMARLINELMDVARIRMGRPLNLERRAVDLVQLTSQMVAEFDGATDRHAFELQADVPELIGLWDGFRVERVLSNLFGNAVKYCPEGCRVAVRVRRLDEAQGSWAELSVSDQGIGIPAADLPRVFERFHRGRNVVGRIRGEGIGLAGAKQIVEQHGGTIAVDSVEGQGSTFTLRLPLADVRHG